MRTPLPLVFLFSVLHAGCGDEAPPSGTSSEASAIPDTATTAAERSNFQWIPWPEAPQRIKEALRSIGYPKAEGNVGDDTQADYDSGCTDIRVAEHDFDGDGEPGIVLAKTCMDYCGSRGCSFEVFEDQGRS